MIIRILLVLILTATFTTAFTPAQETYTAAQALKVQNDSITALTGITTKLSDNFKLSPMMQRYIYQNLYYYQITRLNEKDAIFPRVNNTKEGYNETYPTISTQYVLQQDKEYLVRLKEFVNLHCKYNDYKDENVCKPETINAILGE